MNRCTALSKAHTQKYSDGNHNFFFGILMLRSFSSRFVDCVSWWLAQFVIDVKQHDVYAKERIPKTMCTHCHQSCSKCRMDVAARSLRFTCKLPMTLMNYFNNLLSNFWPSFRITTIFFVTFMTLRQAKICHEMKKKQKKHYKKLNFPQCGI